MDEATPNETPAPQLPDPMPSEGTCVRYHCEPIKVPAVKEDGKIIEPAREITHLAAVLCGVDDAGGATLKIIQRGKGGILKKEGVPFGVAVGHWSPES
jgi:hypothetical protein